MSRPLPLMFAFLLLASCNQNAQPNGNSDSVANIVAIERPANRCAPPILAMADDVQPIGEGSALLDETKANFATAYESACAKEWLNDKSLIDPQATDQKQLFLINAPEANVASIYLSRIDGNKMVLEYPYLTTEGKTQVPSIEELEEAIYCAVVGATPEEQESSGRCLVD